jgi:DNA-binding MarR family transcriptional regulator
MEPGTVEQLRRMEARGYIVRRASQVDRRKIHVFLTPKGHALNGEVVPLARALNDKVLRGMSADDVQRLRACLLQIRKNVRAMPSRQRRQDG